MMDGHITYPIPGDFLTSVGGVERREEKGTRASETGVAYSTWHSESRGGTTCWIPEWDRMIDD